MNQSKIQNLKSKIFLGIDGGQSHTEAVISDENGIISGRGFGGASNHAEQPGGRERLENAIRNSVGEALKDADLPPVRDLMFAAAHCGMTGGADYKEKIIKEILQTESLVVGHDAPTAFFGATAGQPGIVVIAGTGSIVYGENEKGETARVGGLGYLFSDEGSGFWLAVQTVKLAIGEQDGLLPATGVKDLVLNFFGCETIREMTSNFYNAKISRDEFASLAKAAQNTAALADNKMIAAQIKIGASELIGNVKTAASHLQFEEKFLVAGVGGMFRGQLMRQYFQESLAAEVPNAVFVEPKFNPAIGALLLAFGQTGIVLNKSLLANLEKSSKKNEQNS